jgi:uncharacterized membrane protein
VVKDILLWIVVALIVGVASNLTSGILMGPLMCSAFYMLLRKIRTGEGPDMNNFGKGFEVFVQALLAWLVSFVLMWVGTLLCIIPGIVLGVAYVFIYPLVMDRGMDFWTAMETSRKKVFEDFWGFLLFAIVCGLVMILGALCLGVGVLVAMPVVLAAQAYAYEDLFGGSVAVESAEPQPAAA